MKGIFTAAFIDVTSRDVIVVTSLPNSDVTFINRDIDDVSAHDGDSLLDLDSVQLLLQSVEFYLHYPPTRTFPPSWIAMATDRVSFDWWKPT